MMASSCLPPGSVKYVKFVRVPKAPPDSDAFQAAASGDSDWLRFSLTRVLSPLQTDKEGLTVLHVAALHGKLACLKLLLESGYFDVNASCPHGRRPIHMVLTAQSKPHSYRCLTYLLEHGAKPNVSTGEGLTPLHLAASEGLRECTEALVASGAEIHVQDSRGQTPLDLARIWGHRHIARFLKDAMWRRDKEKDLGRRKTLQSLRQNLITMHDLAQRREKVARQAVNEQRVTEWARKKGLPLLWTPERGTWRPSHDAHCFSQERDRPRRGREKGRPPGTPKEMWDISPNPSKPPRASIGRPHSVRMSGLPETPPHEPDLRQTVSLGYDADGCPRYVANWNQSPQPVPALPLDVLQRGLFPAAFPSRIASPQDFQPSTVLDLPHLGGTPGSNVSPWSEIAMHLAEELVPGRY